MCLIFFLTVLASAKCENETTVDTVSTIGSTDNVSMVWSDDRLNGTFENATCDTNETFCDISEDESVVTKKISSVPDLSKEIEEYSDVDVCTCDLQMGFCDINCCCDVDCTFENKLVFDRCDHDDDHVYDTNFCKYSMRIYKNNTPYQWEINQNGLFCIVKSNLPLEYSVHEKLVIGNVGEANLRKTHKYFWHSSDEDLYEEVFAFNGTARAGQNIWLVRNNEIVPFDIPDNFATGSCLAMKRVTFLNPIKTQCLQGNINPYNEALRLSHYVGNRTVLNVSHAFNLTDLKDCPRNICIPFDVKLCDERLQNCLKVIDASTIRKLDEGDPCENVVKKIKFSFFHNGTSGPIKIEVCAHLQNATCDAKGVLQEFEVVFAWFDQKVNYSSLRSGNPGYIDGKFVLIGLLAINGTNFTLTRNARDITENFLVFPDSRNGYCTLSNSSNVPVEFGYDVVLKCRIGEKMYVKNLTASAVCVSIQKIIFSYWSVSSVNASKIIGMFGNADVNDPNDWLSVWYDVQPGNVLNSTVGNFTGEALKCENLRTVLRIEIFHGREVVGNVHNQQKIVWTSFYFGNGSHVDFELRSDEIDFEIELRIEVGFIDVTTDKIRKFVEPPSLDIKLPHDFFYPFVKMDGGSGCVGCDFNRVLLFFVISFSWFVSNN